MEKKTPYNALSFQSNGKDNFCRMAYQPALLAMVADLNYLQGSIISGLAIYAATNDPKDLGKPRHYALMGLSAFGNVCAKPTPQALVAAKCYIAKNNFENMRHIISDTLHQNYESVYRQITTMYKGYTTNE